MFGRSDFQCSPAFLVVILASEVANHPVAECTCHSHGECICRACKAKCKAGFLVRTIVITFTFSGYYPVRVHRRQEHTAWHSGAGRLRLSGSFRRRTGRRSRGLRRSRNEESLFYGCWWLFIIGKGTKLCRKRARMSLIFHKICLNRMKALRIENMFPKVHIPIL